MSRQTPTDRERTPSSPDPLEIIPPTPSSARRSRTPGSAAASPVKLTIEIEDRNEGHHVTLDPEPMDEEEAKTPRAVEKRKRKRKAKQDMFEEYTMPLNDTWTRQHWKQVHHLLDTISVPKNTPKTKLAKKEEQLVELFMEKHAALDREQVQRRFLAARLVRQAAGR